MLQSESEKDKRAALPYACLHKNFVNRGHFSQLATDCELTGLDLHLQSYLLAHAQLKNRRRMRFANMHKLLNALGWPRTAQYYQAATDGLCRLREAELTVDEWLGKRYPGDSRGVYNNVHFPSLMYTNYRERDGRISLAIPKAFWDANDRGVGKYCAIWPHEIRKIRYLPDILLYMLLRAYDDKLEWGSRYFTDRMGLEKCSEKVRIARIATALNRINKATPCDFDMDTRVTKHSDDLIIEIKVSNPYSKKIKRLLSLDEAFDGDGNYRFEAGYRR